MRRGGSEPSVDVCNVALRACLRGTPRKFAPQRVIPLIQEMWRLGPEPNTKSYAIVLKACQMGCRSQRPPWDWAYYAVQQAERRGRPLTEWAYCQALKTCRRDLWAEAMWILDRMQQTGVTPSSSSLGWVAQSCRNCGRVEESEHVLKMLDASSAKRGVRFFQAASWACEGARLWERSLQLLDDCQRLGVTTTRAAFESSTFACARAGKWAAAMALLDKARDNSIRPTPESELIVRLMQQSAEEENVAAVEEEEEEEQEEEEEEQSSGRL